MSTCPHCEINQELQDLIPDDLPKYERDLEIAWLTTLTHGYAEPEQEEIWKSVYRSIIKPS